MFLVQVLPDWRRQRPHGACTEAMGPEEQEAFAQGLATFMTSLSTRKPGQAALLDDGESTERLPNMYFAQSLDKQLTAGVGKCLGTFAVKHRAARALRMREKRYFVDATEIDGAALLDEEAGRLRSCIEGEVSGERWLELPEERDESGVPVSPPLLCVVTDEGPIGAPFIYYLCGELNARVVKIVDPFHKTWNLVKGSVRHAGFWDLIQEWTWTINALHGPWMGDAFFETVRAAGQEYFSKATHECDMFRFLYPFLCDVAGDVSPERGTEPHLKKMFAAAKESPVFRRKGDHVKLGRWMSFWREMDARDGDWGVLQLVLLYVGRREGWWTDIDSSPVCTAFELEPAPAPAPEPAPGSSGVPADNAAPRRVKLSNHELQELRNRSKNTLDLALRVVSNKPRYNVMMMLRAVVSPLRITFDEDQARLRTKRGGVTTVLQWGDTGRTTELLYNMLSAGSDGGALLKMGLKQPWPGQTAAQVKMDKLTANELLRFSVELAGDRFVQSMHFASAPPWLFYRLVHTDEAVVEATLQRLSLVWEWLNKAERAACHDAALSAYVASLCWPRWIWIRELFVRLAEYQFVRVPRTVRVEVCHVLHGVLTTALNEDGMNVLRRVERTSPNNTMCARRTWHALNASGLLADYGRQTPRVTNAAKEAVKTTRVPDALFMPDTGDFSLGGMQALDSYRNSDYTSPSPEAYHEMPMRLESAMACRTNAYLTSFYGLMAHKPCLIRRAKDRPDPAFYLVLHQSKGGVIGYRVRLAEGCTAECPAWLPQRPSPGTRPVKFIGIYDLETWKIQPVLMTPPSAKPPGITAGGCYIVKAGRLRSLLVHSAHECFVGVNVDLLSGLLAEAGLVYAKASDRPKNARSICEALIRGLIPDVTDAEVEDILRKRFGAPKTTLEPSVLNEPGVLEQVGGCMDKSDLEEALKSRAILLKKQNDAKPPPLPSSSAPRPAGGGVAPGSELQRILVKSCTPKGV